MKTDDPKLTAYALGELDLAERADIDDLLRKDAEIATHVDETRALADRLRKELRSEEAAALSQTQRQAVLDALRRPPQADPVDMARVVGRWGTWMLRLAACIAVGAIAVGVWFPPSSIDTPWEGQLAQSDTRSSRLADGLAPGDAVTKSTTDPELGVQEEIAPAPRPDGGRQRVAIDAAASVPHPDRPAASPAEDVALRGLIARAPGEKNTLKPENPVIRLPAANHPAPTAQPQVIGTTELALGAKVAIDENRSGSREAKELDASKKREQAAKPTSGLADATAPLGSAARDAMRGRDRYARVEQLSPPKDPAGVTLLPEQQRAFGGAWKSYRSDSSSLASVRSPAPSDHGNLLQLQKQATMNNTEAYDAIVDNPFLEARANPLSTFSIDVDSASYANVRRFLNSGQRPPKGAVRIEELINYFSYEYPQPEAGQAFSATLEVATCPWRSEHRLLRVGLKGRDIKRDQRPASNLVFLIDVSGSMQPANKLPLVKESLRLLIDQLGGEDSVAMAVYAGASGCVLEPTRDKEAMRGAVERLEAGGSTNGASGIQLAYELAQRAFIKDGVNRVILATDGDFNVGVTNQSALVDLITEKAKSGVFLTVLGFGIDNLKDSTLEKLADKGNGNYAYIDTLNEGRRVLVEQMSGTLVTIAKDVKIQVEFNPAQVAAYRLIGYENRILRKEDFNDDSKDAGEIGAGHTVTVLYEIVPAGKAAPAPVVDALKYQQQPEAVVAKRVETAASKELLTLKLRHKKPDDDKSQLLEVALTDQGAPWEKSSRDFRFAAAVASFGMLLRDSPHKGNANWSNTLELALEGKGEDMNGYRAEFISLIDKAKSLVTENLR